VPFLALPEALAQGYEKKLRRQNGAAIRRVSRRELDGRGYQEKPSLDQRNGKGQKENASWTRERNGANYSSDLYFTLSNKLDPGWSTRWGANDHKPEGSQL